MNESKPQTGYSFILFLLWRSGRRMDGRSAQALSCLAFYWWVPAERLEFLGGRVSNKDGNTLGLGVKLWEAGDDF